MKKSVAIGVVALAIGVLIGYFVFNNKIETEKLESLPLPEVTGGERGMLGIDKNINEIHEKAFEEMRHEGEEAMPIFFNFTHEEATSGKTKINYIEDKFCDNTCKVYYLLGEGETPSENLNYWHMEDGKPTPYNPVA